MDDCTIDGIKNYLMEVSDNGEELDSGWVEGFLIGLNYAGKISSTELDQLMNWSKE